jgi:DNA-binding winged helix-turn-helix (wHTH) protein/tetratricopeptide (TPR) repeat protein
MKLFGPFRLDTVNHCLWRAEERMPLTPKAFDVLRYLMERADRVVTQHEILEGLWPETYVDPEGVRKYILEIRKVLGDQPRQPLFIETIPKRGYQFIGKVTEEQTAPPSGVASRAAANIVGRDAALAQLHSYLETAQTGQRQVIFVTGEAGIGKTTLLDVFQQQAACHSDLLFARGQCIEGFGGTEAYYPMLEAVGSLVSKGKDGSLAELLGKRAPTWLVQFPSLVRPEQRDALQREILGSTRTRMVREICEALEAMCAKDPLIVILEDLHWADTSTVDLISAFARRRESAKLLVIGTYRPVDVALSHSPLKGLEHDLLLHELCHEIAVERLAESDVAEYLANEFADNSFPSSLASLIHHNSGGNALFMVVIVRDFVKTGLIAQDLGTFHLTAPLQEVYRDIPETLQQMLNLQFEQLSAEERRVLQSCSVAGERFSVWAVAVMLEAAPTSIEETCDKLAQREQFIRFVGIYESANGADSTHYEFRHTLYRQALYRGLSSLSRSTLHRSLGEQLMPICTAGKTELASQVALHFEEGRNYEQAARYLILTAENDTRRFAHGDSIRVLQHALQLTRLLVARARFELEIQILQRIGDAYYALAAMSDAFAAYERAAVRAAEAGFRKAQVDALSRMAFPAWYLDPARGNDICEQAIALSRQHGDPLLLAQRLLAAGCFRLLYDAWRTEDAGVCASAHLTIRHLNGPSIREDLLYAYVQAIQGDYEEALAGAEAGLIASTSSAAYLLALRVKSLSLMLGGHFGEALRTVRAGQELTRKNGENLRDPWIFILREVWLRALCYDFEGIREFEQLIMSNGTEQASAEPRAIARIASGYAELYQGKHREALQSFTQIRDREMPGFFLHWHWRMHVRLGLSEAWLQAGDVPNARLEVDDFLDSALSMAEPNMQALAWETQARVAGAEKDTSRARQCLESALAILDKFDIPVSAWRVHATAWHLYRDLGDYEKADGHRARAKEIIKRVADSFEPGEPLRLSLLAARPIRNIFEQYTSA